MALKEKEVHYTINNKDKSFNRNAWIVQTDKDSRYESMCNTLKEMNVLKAFSSMI